MSLFRSTATIGFYTLLSRVLGFIRDVTIASSLGASWLSDAFFVAFKLPNFLRRLFAEGAFNAAFVPMFSGMLAGEGKDAAKAFAEEAYSFLMAVLLLLSVVCIAVMPWLMFVLAPGFSDDPAKFELTVLLTRITFPYIIFISAVSLMGGILNSLDKFAAVAATPILLNICLIAVPPLVAPWVPTEAHGLAVAVFVAGVVQMVWLMVWCAKLRMLPRLRAPRLTAQVKKLLALIAPAAAGAGVAQINLFVDLIIASHIAGGVSYLYYADRINELPLAVIGIALGTVLLPSLSRYVREGQHEAAKALQNRGMELALLLALPAAAALMSVAGPIVQVLYERGAFGADDTLKTQWALVAFAAGLPAFVLVKVLTPAFYANQDTQTPFRIALVCIAVNFLLNITLIWPFQHVGMAMATTASGWLNVVLMLRVLKQRDMFTPDVLLRARLPRMLAASALMAAALVAFAEALHEAWHGVFVEKAAALAALVGLGLVVYAAAATLLHAYDHSRVRGLLRRGR